MNKTLILVVEDDRPVRNLIVTTLKTHDYKYLTAENGTTAIMEASSHQPDIILLDLGLPDMEGVDVIKKIRTWSNVPIIVISARSEDADKIEALDAGADDYITKPFSVEELLARIRVTIRRLAMLGMGEMQDTSVFENGDLKIDYTAGCTYLKEEELHLTPIEYKLLCLLARNVGKVLTHTYITQQKMILHPFAFLWQLCEENWNRIKTELLIYRHISELGIGCLKFDFRMLLDLFFDKHEQEADEEEQAGQPDRAHAKTRKQMSANSGTKSKQ